jgi:hypothetical protein
MDSLLDVLLRAYTGQNNSGTHRSAVLCLNLKRYRVLYAKLSPMGSGISGFGTFRNVIGSTRDCVLMMRMLFGVPRAKVTMRLKIAVIFPQLVFPILLFR